jgi:hypothetical protein
MEDKLITDISAGMTVRNIAAKYRWETEGEGLTASRDDKFPITFAFGGSCRAFNKKLLIAIDLEKNTEQDALVRFGGEYELYDRLLLRSGINDGIFTAGAGFKFLIRDVILYVNYAFSSERSEEGNDHLFTLDLQF